ncbi:asparaginase [Frankia sp. EAN1pec]|uniref:asparaginase n=1 Tax=Parafrankia sp. (strain EAN1pec) TaxID=298653 RepID=UPI00059E71EF
MSESGGGVAPPVVAWIERDTATDRDTDRDTDTDTGMATVLVESRIRGTVVGLDPAGAVVLSVGDPTAVISPRSTVKPMQAVGMLLAGLDAAFGSGAGAASRAAAVSGAGDPASGVGDSDSGHPDCGAASERGGGIPSELLAIVSSSHSGEPEQLAAVRAVLAAAGRGEDALACPADLPIGRLAHERHLAAGGGPERLLMNCSGKHAGMIATCVAAGWPVAGYTDPAHPLQRRIRAVIEELTGATITSTAVDGCGAPLFGIPLLGLAHGMREIALAAAGPRSPRQRVAAAMRAFPALIGGPGRPDTELMLAAPWIIAKDGAEGVTVAATAAGYAVAVKIEDGSQRAAMPVLVTALRRIGALDPTPGPGAAVGLDAGRLDALAAPAVLGGGVPVGRLRPFLPSAP